MRVEPACPAPSQNAGPNGTEASGNGETNRPEFPSARYFQVHFEYIEELLGEARRCLEALSVQVAEFQRNADADPAKKSGRELRKQSSAGPKLSLQGERKSREARRKSLHSSNPMLGTVSEK